MLDRRFVAEGTAIVVLAVLCAAVSNFAAARDRKVAFVGDYPRALQVPAKAVEPGPEMTALVALPSTTTTEVTTTTEPPVATDSATTSTVATHPPVAPPTTSSASPQTPKSASPAAQVKLPAGVPAPPKKAFLPHPDKAWLEITNEDAMQLWHEKAIFIDARRTEVFNQGHIAGSRTMPVWEADIDDRIRAFFDEVTDQQRPIVVYCSGGNCEDSHMLADKLWGAGYENVWVYKDGFPGWQKVGGAVQ